MLSIQRELRKTIVCVTHDIDEAIKLGDHVAVLSNARSPRVLAEATLAGERRALTNGALLGQVLRMPWMAVKVVVGIHWEALKLWLRGAGYRLGLEP